jgi:hypothetical protein
MAATIQIRGSQIAFKNIFFDEPETPVVSLTKINGRNQELNQQRNECLVDRYYYICRSRGTDYNYDASVKEVAAQFFLSPYYAGKVILNHPSQLTSLKIKWKNEPIEKMAKHFAKKWSHLVW